MKLYRDIASDIQGLRGIIQLLPNFIKLQNSDPIALNKFVNMWSFIVRLIIYMHVLDTILY